VQHSLSFRPRVATGGLSTPVWTVFSHFSIPVPFRAKEKNTKLPPWLHSCSDCCGPVCSIYSCYYGTFLFKIKSNGIVCRPYLQFAQTQILELCWAREQSKQYGIVTLWWTQQLCNNGLTTNTTQVPILKSATRRGVKPSIPSLAWSKLRKKDKQF